MQGFKLKYKGQLHYILIVTCSGSLPGSGAEFLFSQSFYFLCLEKTFFCPETVALIFYKWSFVCVASNKLVGSLAWNAKQAQSTDNSAAALSNWSF